MTQKKWQQIEQSYTKWDNEGAELTGVLGVLFQRDSNGTPQDLCTLVNEAGIEVEFSCPTDLKRQLDRINPGKEVKIVYKGITQTMSNRPFKLFEVFEAVS